MIYNWNIIVKSSLIHCFGDVSRRGGRVVKAMDC